MTVLVTGASGFVGRALCDYLSKIGRDVVAAVRSPEKRVSGVRNKVVGTINGQTEWAEHLQDVDVVVHLAARAHKLSDSSADPLGEFRSINALGTQKLVSDCIKVGVSKFIFVSSIGVNGATTAGAPFTAGDVPRPHTPYAISKLEAELEIQRLCQDSQMDYVILRPPLIYGRDAPGNLGLIQSALRYRIPLPFGSVTNRRSFLAIENFVSIVDICISQPKAANRVLLISDGVDLSTAEFLELAGQLMQRTPILVSVKPAWVRFFLRKLGKNSAVDSLLCDLQVASSHLVKELGWKPIFDVSTWLGARKNGPNRSLGKF